jgi:hypothetical protein
MGTNLSVRQAVGGLPPATQAFKKSARGTNPSPAMCLITWEGIGHMPLAADPQNRPRVYANSSAVNGSKSAMGTGGAASGPASGSKKRDRKESVKVAGAIAEAACGCECA